MRYPNAAKGIKKIYLAEILGILALVLAIVMAIMVAGSHVDTSISGEEAAQALQAANIGTPFVIVGVAMMLLMLLLLWWPHRRHTTPFHWDWAIIGVSLFLSTADFLYFYSLSLPSAMISIVSMVRRGSVIVSFLCGAMFFHEKNLRAKAIDLALVLLGMIFLYIGSR